MNSPPVSGGRAATTISAVSPKSTLTQTSFKPIVTPTLNQSVTDAIFSQSLETIAATIQPIDTVTVMEDAVVKGFDAGMRKQYNELRAYRAGQDKQFLLESPHTKGGCTIVGNVGYVVVTLPKVSTNEIMLCHTDVIIPLAKHVHDCDPSGKINWQVYVEAEDVSNICFHCLKIVFPFAGFTSVKDNKHCARSTCSYIGPSIRLNSLDYLSSFKAALETLKSRVTPAIHNAADEQDNILFLHGHNHVVQTAPFIKHLERNITSVFGTQVKYINTDELEPTMVTQISNPTIQVIFCVHGESCVWAMYCRKCIFVHIMPRGVEYWDQIVVERIMNLGNVYYLNHRAIGDSHSSRTKGDPLAPFEMPWKEGFKLLMEILILKSMQLPKLQSKIASETYSSFVRYSKRNKYDPDHFAVRPAGVGRDRIFVNELPPPDVVFGYRKENHDELHKVTVEQRNVKCPEGIVPKTLFIHYPWVRDNIYHQHNDNFLPLYLAFLTRNATTRESRHLALLPTTRSQTPLPTFQEIAEHLFEKVVWFEDIHKDLCYERVIWGRPQRPFAMSIPDVMPYVNHRVHFEFRNYMYNRLKIYPQEVCGPRPCRVTWIERKTKRVLLNEKLLFASVAHHGINLTFCCEGKSFREQVEHMSKTDILIGTHGAGHLHILYLRPGALVVHVASRRLNYHEQTIIERIALLAGVRYMNTRTFTPHDDPNARWEDDFSLPPREFHMMVTQMLLRFSLKT